MKEEYKIVLKNKMVMEIFHDDISHITQVTF